MQTPSNGGEDERVASGVRAGSLRVASGQRKEGGWDSGKIIKGNRLTGAVAQKLKLNPIQEQTGLENEATTGKKIGAGLVGKKDGTVEFKIGKANKEGSLLPRETLEKRKIKKGPGN